MNLVTNQPKVLATAQGNLTRLQMLMLDYTTAYMFSGDSLNVMHKCPIKDFAQIMHMTTSGSDYARIHKAFEHLKQPVLNLPDGKAPLFDNQSTCEQGVMNFRFSQEILSNKCYG